ncbi:hypothetical protein SAMN02745126_02404 [Enhydrobacter aerosaccus]|uniref:Lipoprotein n=1 Tax=Enhydrobacter aerosaccus TaxID=225324 RepID=A0A1T4NRG0_9HYPH|nr:hypothetical protein [Enhydrobacter aerosaccus]SJZ81705.1 hypothetical protein SAMN02745126_02404 [Enhydrobacter aerosaccus]
MIGPRFVPLVPLVAALALGGCGPSEKEQMAADYCPRPFQVQDAQNLTRFKPGSAGDPRDIMFQAEMTGAATGCSLGKGQMNVNLVVRVAVTPGPAVSSGTTSVPYFVRVLDGNGRVLQGQEFNADFPLTPSGPAKTSREELTLTLPFSKPSDVISYQIAVGLKPTMQELEYNRRSGQR